LVLADGLPYLTRKVDIISVLGMGGRLIAQILQEANLSNVKRLVLSPNSEAKELRSFLEENNWRIIDENFIKEKSKFYQIICAEKGSMILNDLEKEFGPIIIKNRNENFVEYIQKNIKILESGSTKIKEQNILNELKARIHALEEVILECSRNY